MKKKILFGIKFVLLFGFLYWHVLLLFAVNWLLKTWGLLTIDEVVFQLKASFDGTNSDMVQEFWLHHGLPAFLMAVVFYGIFWYLYRKYKEKRFWVYLVFFVFGFSLFGFCSCILFIALSPNGVAAFPSPNMFEIIFIEISSCVFLLSLLSGNK